MKENDGLPTNICHRCLYSTELFSEFRDGVHQCEQKLQNFVLTLASHSNDVTPARWNLDDILNDQHESNDFHPNSVVVIDPMKCYVSSDQESDEDETVEIPKQGSELSNDSFKTMSSTMTTQRDTSRANVSSESSKFGFEDIRPLRNVCFCKYCEAAFVQRHDCETHQDSHDPVMPHACNFCPFRCDNQQDFIGHIKQFHDPIRPYFCTQCNKNFGRRADLRKHAVSHTGIRPFSCPVCGKSFSRKTNVTNHMKVHEGKKHTHKEPQPRHEKPQPQLARSTLPIGYPPMPIDAFQQPYQSYPSQHFQSEQFLPPKPENAIYSKCTVKSAPNTIPKLKLKLKKPVVATTLKKFSCATCKKSFKTKRDLDRHGQIHAGIKFHCAICQKGFTRRDKLLRHEKIHANRNKTAALPESAFLPENLKRSHFSTERKASPATISSLIDKPIFTPDTFRPQFYAEYDLSETNN